MDEVLGQGVDPEDRSPQEDPDGSLRAAIITFVMWVTSLFTDQATDRRDEEESPLSTAIETWTRRTFLAALIAVIGAVVWRIFF